MKINKGDLIRFPRNGKKEIALVLHVNKNKRTQKLNVYKILCNDKITHTIHYQLEKLWKTVFSQKKYLIINI